MLRLTFGALTLAMAVMTYRAFRAARLFGDLNSSSVLMFSTVVLPSSAIAVATLLGGRQVFADVFYNRVSVIVGPAARLVVVASPLLLMIAVVVIVRRLRLDARLNSAGLATIVLVVVAAIAGGLAGEPLLTGSRVTYLLVLAAATVAIPGRGAVAGTAFGVAALAILGSLAAFATPDFAILPCDGQSCSPVKFVLVGAADNQNAMALFLTMGVPFVYLGFRRYGAHMAALLVAMVLCSGSLTATAGAAVTLAILLMIRPDEKWQPTRCLPALRVTAITAGAAIVVVPFLGLDQNEFTGRVRLWNIALNQVRDHLLLGQGPAVWRGYVDAGRIPLATGYSTHNQFVEVLFVSGILGVAIVLAIVTMVMMRARGQIATICMFALPALVCGFAERPWNLGGIDWLAWTVPALLLAVQPASRDRPLDTRNTKFASQAHAQITKAQIRRRRLAYKNGVLPTKVYRRF